MTGKVVMSLYQHIETNKRKTQVLIIAFMVIIIGLGWLLDELLGGGYIIFFGAMLLALCMSLASYYKGDAIALKMSKAAPLAKKDNPYVYRLVENLAITAGIPLPRIHLINDTSLNAFATGRDPEHASIALTTGIIETLENEELEGVIAHELSHIKNYDIRLMMIVIVLIGIIGLLADILLRAHWFGGGRRDRGGKAGAILLIAALLAAILAPIAAQLIRLAISRKREFLADTSGALLTRYPEGLARALEKISKSPPLHHAHAGSAHLFIANPFGKKASFLERMFSTHPPIEERVAQLRQL